MYLFIGIGQTPKWNWKVGWWAYY